jgi:hypothetical protein
LNKIKSDLSGVQHGSLSDANHFDSGNRGTKDEQEVFEKSAACSKAGTQLNKSYGFTMFAYSLCKSFFAVFHNLFKR